VDEVIIKQPNKVYGSYKHKQKLEKQ